MSDQEEVTAKLYVYNEIIETQLYMLDRLLEFNERGGDDGFYDDFKPDLIKAATATFRQLRRVQTLIANDLKSQEDENRGDAK